MGLAYLDLRSTGMPSAAKQAKAIIFAIEGNECR